MAGNFRPDWTLTWTNAGSAAANFFGDIAGNIVNNTVTISNTITQDLQSATEVAVAATMPGTAGQGIRIYLLKERPDGSYQSVANGDPAWGFSLPLTTSTYFGQTFTVPGWETPRFQIAFHNLTTTNVVANYWCTYRQVTGNYV